MAAPMAATMTATMAVTMAAAMTATTVVYRNPCAVRQERSCVESGVESGVESVIGIGGYAHVRGETQML